MKRERTSAEYREGFEVCQRAARHMRQLLEALLILAREDSGENAINREPCMLDEIARDGVELLRPLAEERNVKVHLDLEEAPVTGDALQLGQVVINLVKNAIDYNRDGGEVRVSVRREDDGALLVVSDNGLGIADADLPQVFERFFRADRSRSSTDGHTGLGLAICKAIVEAHEGSIEVCGQANEGTLFTVRI